MSWTRLLDRLLRKVLAANRKASATASTDAFDRLKAIADEGIIPFCEKALGFTPTDYQAKFPPGHEAVRGPMLVPTVRERLFGFKQALLVRR